MQEILIQKFVRQLLQSKQLKKLFLFAKYLETELKSWLIREKKKAATILPDQFLDYLASLHLQFAIPFPSFNTFDSLEDLLLKVKKPSVIISPSNKSILVQLLQDMQSAQCIEWALLIATALQDLPTLLLLLKQHMILWKPFKLMLQSLSTTTTTTTTIPTTNSLRYLQIFIYTF
jgi:hypothetical protein